MPLALRIRLRHLGWLTATLTEDEVTEKLTASYLRHATADLLKAATALADGALHTECRWLEEPGEFRWVFDRLGPSVRLRVLWFQETLSDLPEDAGQLVFSIVQQPDMLLAAIADAATDVLETMGPDGYLKAWGEAFPAEELAHLTMVLPR